MERVNQLVIELKPRFSALITACLVGYAAALSAICRGVISVPEECSVSQNGHRRLQPLSRIKTAGTPLKCPSP